MNRATCYISYCWEDTEYEDIFKKIKADIELKSNNKISVILDKLTFKVSENFKEKEKLILSSDCVVSFFSPNFNKAIIKRDSSRGVFREYLYIREKFESNNESVIPVLLKGEEAFAIPDAFSDIIYLDFRNISFDVNKRNISVSDNSRTKYNKFIEHIIKRVNNLHKNAEYKFVDNHEKYEVLLRNTAADGKLLKKCMIKMNAYDEILTQRVYFIIGRKGSGKSTFLETLGRLDAVRIDRHYKSLRTIYAENINVNALYHIIKSTRSDNIIFPVNDITDIFWEILFVLQGMYIVSTDVELYIIEDDRRQAFRTVTNKLKSMLGLAKTDPIDQLTASKGIPTLAMELINNYLKHHIIDNSNYETLLTSTKVNFSALKILETSFKKPILEKYIQALRLCTKRILISLDGFDTYSEDFRRKTRSMKHTDNVEYEERTEFESKFYRSLIKVVTEFKRIPYGNYLDMVCAHTDFCIVLPKDRWDQIKDIDRDISKKKYCGLSWTALDLLKMLVYRLENYYDIECDDDFYNRWCNILASKLQGITPTIKVNIGGRDVAFDLFNYILRLSFWRPRDILLHFIALLDLHDESRKNKITIDDSAIKNSLNRSARKIIEEEFIQEYQNVFYNIKDVLNEFYEDRLITPLAEFCAKLSKIRFDASFAYEDNNRLENKLSILYQLGIIGLYYEDQEWARKQYFYHICFYFKDGYAPMSDLLDRRDLSNEKVKIIFNPIFAKQLKLDFNTNEPICNYSWQEICTIRTREI